MKRIRIRVAYDGTSYCGFQIQPGVPSVEGELNRALSELTGEDIHIIGASRTDAGVHAAGNVAVFDTESSIPAERYPYAAVRFLPPDIRITYGDLVPDDWHPRKQKSKKTYVYTIYCGSVEDPFTRLYASHIKRNLDIPRMEKAASYLKGEHDFTSFANPSSEVLKNGGTAVRTIYSISIDKTPVPVWDFNKVMLPGNGCPADGISPSLIRITVTGSGFLYNMVRIIAGTLINVGKGLWEPERVSEALKACDRTAAGPTAEARGLKLMDIRYNS